MIQEMMKVIKNIEIAKDIYEMVLEGDIAQEIKEPGQFIHIKLKDESMLLRRPISIASHTDKHLTILYKIVGKGTKAMSELKTKDNLDVLGPLGNGFKIKNIPDNQNILLVGAGIGIAPLYELSRQLYQQGHTLNVVLSYTKKEEAYYISEFQELGKVHISTDDGSLGMQGYCEDLIKTLPANYNYVYACGPEIVLKFIKKHFEKIDHLYLSLEQRMACGIGACYACDTAKKNKRICKDGPVFKANEIQL